MDHRPSATHPWRQYANRAKTDPKTNGNGHTAVARRPLQFFLSDIVNNWGRVQIAVKYHGRFDSFTLLELPDKMVALWLNQALRRYQNEHFDEDSEEDALDEVGI